MWWERSSDTIRMGTMTFPMYDTRTRRRRLAIKLVRQDGQHKGTACLRYYYRYVYKYNACNDDEFSTYGTCVMISKIVLAFVFIYLLVEHLFLTKMTSSTPACSSHSVYGERCRIIKQADRVISRFMVHRNGTPMSM